MSEAPERLDLAEDPMGGWWSAADAPPEARVAFVRADRYDEAVRQRDVLRAACEAVIAKNRGVSVSMLGGEYFSVEEIVAALASGEKA